MYDKTLVYITQTINYSDASCGVWKKIQDQCRAINANKVNVFLICRTERNQRKRTGEYQIFSVRDGDIYLEEIEEYCIDLSIVSFEKYLAVYGLLEFSLRVLKGKKVDGIYIRAFSPLFPALLKFLKELKKITKGKIFWAIPTFPYRKNHGNILYKFLDVLYFKRIQILSDYIVVNADGYRKSLLKDKVIFLSNGVDVERIKKRKCIYLQKKAKEIQLLCLANYAPSHGYERLIMGIVKYYSKESRKFDFYVHFVGTGMEELKKMAMVSGLLNRMHFYGPLFGKALDEIFDKVDIAVGSLNPYGIGINGKNSVLKVKEYIVRGIPYISACEDIDIPIDYPYKCILPNDSRPIDMEKIILFYKKLPDANYVSSEMNAFAKQNLSWKLKMSFIKELI